jgi:DNA polymerase III alpha subunit
MLFDHHIHSRYSELDSISEVDEIIAEAVKLGLGGIAISDHNATEGSFEAAKKCSKELIIIASA